MQTFKSPLLAVLSVAVLGGAPVTHAADLGTTDVVPADQIKKSVPATAPKPASRNAPNTGKSLNVAPGNDQALRNAAQPTLPAPGASATTIPQNAVQPKQLPDADLSGMRRTDGSSPPAGPFGSINDHRPPIYPDARETLNTSPRNEQALRDANRPELPQGAVPGLALPGAPSTVPGGSSGTTSRENKGTAGGASGLNNASALGNVKAPDLNQGAVGVGGRKLLENELQQGKVLDPKVAKTLEEIRPLEDAKLADPLSGANPDADPWQRPTAATPGKEAGSAAATAGLIGSPQGKASDDPVATLTPVGQPYHDRPRGEATEESPDGTGTRVYEISDGTTSTVVTSREGTRVRTHDREGRHTGTDGRPGTQDAQLDYVGTDQSGMPITRGVMDALKAIEDETGGKVTGSGSAAQPNENEPQNAGWRGLAPPRPAKAKNEPRGPLVSPVNPDDAIVRIQEEGRRSTAEIKAMVTQPGEGSESGGGDGSGKRDPCRFARPGPDGQLPAGCGGGAGPN